MGAVFLGTPAAAVPSLAALGGIEDVDVVITQPDRPAGRGGRVVASPVKVAALQWGIDVRQPETREELTDEVRRIHARFGLVVAYGRILTPTILASTQLGFLNVHFSLLPRWRGAAPVERAIAAGDERTGVTLMKLDEGIDTGPIIGEIATPIGPAETGGTLTARLSYLGASLLDTALPDYLQGRRHPVPQIDTEPSHARMLTKAEARLNPTWGHARAERSVRAFMPRPVAWLDTPEGSVRVLDAAPSSLTTDRGTITSVMGTVCAGFEDGSLELRTVQPEGKSPMAASAWMNGRRNAATSFRSDPDPSLDDDRR